MVTLRSTQKLLRRLGLPPKLATSAPTTVLGDWYANLYYTRPHQLVLCLSERTLLAVLIPARDSKSLGSRFRDGVLALLARLGVPPAAVDAEGRAMGEVAFGPTANRRVLGCLNEAAYAISIEAELGRRTSATDHELFLSENIYALTGYREPRELVLELFAASGVSSGRAVSGVH
jgi:hypothetical protein